MRLFAGRGWLSASYEFFAHKAKNYRHRVAVFSFANQGRWRSYWYNVNLLSFVFFLVLHAGFEPAILEECIRDIKGLSTELKKKRREILLKLTDHDIIKTAESLKDTCGGSVLVSIAGHQAMKKEKSFLKQKGFRITDISI